MSALIKHSVIRVAAGMLALSAAAVHAQQTSPIPPRPQAEPAQSSPESPAAAPSAQTSEPAKDAPQPSRGARRRAVKLYLLGTKLFEQQQFDEALKDYSQAATLDPANTQYSLAAQVARGHVVTALIQTAAKDRNLGDAAAARAALTRALELDPQNEQVAAHLGELGDEAIAGQAEPPYAEGVASIGGPQQLEPGPGLHSFHLRSTQRQIIQQVFKQYGIDATVDDSVRNINTRFDVDDANFADATRVLGVLTKSFYVPLDAHRVVVARDSREIRQQFMRNVAETVYLAGLTPTEMTDMGSLARNVFEVQQSAVDPTSGTLTLRGAESTLNAFNATFRGLMEGRSQVLLDVRLIQLAHTSSRSTGVRLPQQVTAFNVFAAEQSILNANQALVQQIISSGLAAPGDTLAILGILIASGQVSSSLFSNGLALFGGGLTLSGISPQPITGSFSLNSSDSRELDEFQLRLQDGEAGTLRNGSRYPITTSNYSTIGGSGLTLKATPKVMRSSEVALNMDMKISALAGTSVNGLPVLNNRAYSGVVTVKQGEAVVIASEVDKQESRALSGVPGLTEIPGMNNVTEKDVQTNYATLLIIVTPHVIRSPHTEGRSAMVRIEKNAQTR